MRPHIKTKQTIGKKEKNVLAVKLKTSFKKFNKYEYKIWDSGTMWSQVPELRYHMSQ